MNLSLPSKHTSLEKPPDLGPVSLRAIDSPPSLAPSPKRKPTIDHDQVGPICYIGCAPPPYHPRPHRSALFSSSRCGARRFSHSAASAASSKSSAGPTLGENRPKTRQNQGRDSFEESKEGDRPLRLAPDAEEATSIKSIGSRGASQQLHLLKQAPSLVGASVEW